MKVLSKATIFRIEPAHVTYLAPDDVVRAWNEWIPIINAFRASVPAEEVPYHFFWRWDRLAEKTGRDPEKYWILGLCLPGSSRMQGMMLLELEGRASRSNHGLIYVDRLCSAPWNFNLAPSPEYKGIGSVLLAWAVAFSGKLGYDGRVGLHSLRDSEGFYARCGMIDYGIDDEHEGLRYFEFSEEAAARFLHKPRPS